MKTKLPIRLLVLILLGGSFLFSSGQSRIQNPDLRPLLFKNFLKADILKKDGATVQASVNYNTDNQSIIFLTEDKYLEMTGLENIEQVEIDSTIFVPIEGKFYQKTERNDLFISYSNKVAVNDIVSSEAGSEIKNARESSNMVTDVYVSQNYKSKNDLAYVKNFWTMKGNHLVALSDFKKLSKTYNINKKEINDFVKEHKLNFNNHDDMIVLLNYLNKS